MKTQFDIKNFSIPELKGISQKTIDEHLLLYAGYVKNANTIITKINEYSQDKESNTYAIQELQRRFSFEFCGIKNHEYYFKQFEGGLQNINPEKKLFKEIEKEWGSFENFLNRFKAISLTRGIGWAMLYWDKKEERLLTQWVDEQHLGHLINLEPVIALDMWEHSYLFDYTPSQKKDYVEAFFENLNWSVCEDRLDS